MGDLEPRLFRAVAEFREALMEIGMTVERVENYWQTEHELIKALMLIKATAVAVLNSPYTFIEPGGALPPRDDR